jgi:quercetin dioxygenase-like cupin family protein
LEVTTEYDVTPGHARPEFGCFNIATENGLQFRPPQVYWHIRTFANHAAAEAAKSGTGIVVKEDGRVWLSEFGARDLVATGGQCIAIVGPLMLPPAKSYTAVLSYAVMRPGDRSRVHTHPGAEGWYMIVGEQCLETPAGANRAKSGETMTVPPNVPMELSITGANGFKIHVSTCTSALASGNQQQLWTPGEYVAELNSVGARDTRTAIRRRDGLEMIISSNRVGSIGGLDLWVSTRASAQQPWSIPLNLNQHNSDRCLAEGDTNCPVINTTFNDSAPALSWDGQTMIFWSNRPGGFGFNDLFATTRPKIAGQQ